MEHFSLAKFANVSLAALLLQACNATERETPISNAMILDQLQKIASQECLCRMAGRDSSALQAEYERRTRGLENDGVGTASDPVSYGSDYFPSLGENAYVFTGGYVIPDQGKFVCTEDQGIILESVWKKAYDSGGGNAEEADAALLLRLQAMRSQLSERVPQSDCELKASP